MKISPVLLQDKKLAKSNVQKTQSNFEISNSTCSLSAYPKSYYFLSFQARVNKDLNSFIERNEANLPYSIKAYIENLSDEQKQTITPLAAQRNAFEYLAICDSVADIKEAYPDEPLFQNLKEVGEVKSKRGILYDIRLMSEDLDEKETLLSSGENSLSLYLVKKIFLEGKTIGEINEDLDNNLNPVFKKEDKNYILPSTLQALGIQLPSLSYLNSLRYTRDGYSDMMGEKMSKRWADMSQEEKDRIISSHGAKSLSQEQKDSISKFNKKRWMKMSPAQKAQAIDAMQKGGRRKQIAMTDAWNNSPDVRLKLTDYLIENNFYSPQSIIYRTDSYSPAMEIIMTRFWELNPQAAEKLGSEIELSYERYDMALAEGKITTFEDDVIKKSAEIKAQIKKALKVSKDKIEQMSPVDKYRNMFSYLPKKLLDEQCEILSGMSRADVELWIKYCMGQKLDSKALARAEKICNIVAPRMAPQMQHLITASITMFEQCLAPIVNPETNEVFHPIFPSNLDFRFPDIARLYFNLKKHGYEKALILDSSVVSGGDRDKVALDFKTERFTKEIIKRNPDVKFNFNLMDYQYSFSKQPNFELLNELYEELESYKLTENQAQKAARRICPYGLSQQAYDSLAASVYVRPHTYHDVTSANVSEGMKLRVSRGLNEMVLKLGGSHSVLYKKNLINYEKRFLDFFTCKD